MTNREKDQCLQLAEWYAACPDFASDALGADFALWVLLFLWVGMGDE